MKLFAGLALGGAIVFAAATPAGAASPAPTPPSASDLAAARQTAVTASPTIARFFASHGGSAAVSAKAAQQMAPRLSGPAVPVYDLNPAFVTGRSSTIARLAFMATQAVSADGQRASVWTVRQGGAWRLANIASGADEETYARNGGTVFREPQLNAWYALREGRVRPLNLEARQVTGAPSVSLETYQRAVRQRYAGRMPGSSYDQQGMAGGYGPAQNGKAGPVTGKAGDSGGTQGLLLLGGLTLAAGGGLAVRRVVRR